MIWLVFVSLAFAEAPPVCLVDQSALEDVKSAKALNVERKKELDAKEEELKKREEEISLQLKKIEEVRSSVQAIRASQKQEEKAKVAKLVETIFTMSPKAASKLLTTLDDTLAVEVLSELETSRLAKIMNLMEAKRSSFLSELLTGIKKEKGGSHESSDAKKQSS